MQAVLGLVWLSPDDPNWLDRWFGIFTDQTKTADNQLWLAAGIGALMVLALAWRQLQVEPKRLERVLPGIAEGLRDDEKRMWANRVVTAALVFVSLLSCVNYFYGSRNNHIYLHRWDTFHTVLGVKYHRELGYFDLYKCAYAIDQAGPRNFRGVKEIRNLETRVHEPAAQHIAGNDCMQRFTPERLAEFQHDLAEFGAWSNPKTWRKLFRDKGFNGTPFYSTMAKGLVTRIEVSLDSLRRLSYIDPFLMMIGFGFVGWAFGLRKAALVAIIFTTFFPNRYVHMGGSILRYDYMAVILVAFSALKKDKWGLAGGLFAYATMVRVFPAIFVVGVGLKVASDVFVDRKLRDEHWRFFGWFAAIAALLFVISLIGMDGGFDNWRTWAANMKVHNAKSAAYRVGFKHLFMLDGKVLTRNYTHKQSIFVQYQDYYWAATAVLITPILISVRRLDTISFAALFGVLGFFLLSVATRYYWGLAAVLLLVDRDELRNRYMLTMTAVLCFATSFDYFFFAKVSDNAPMMYNVIVGFELTVVVILIGSWLLSNPALVELDADARVPSHVPAQLGARAAPVPLPLEARRGKKGKKSKQAKGKKGEDAGEGDAELDGDSEADDSLSDATTRRDGPPAPDPDAVTISDGGSLGLGPDADTQDDLGERLRKGELRASSSSLSDEADTDEADEPDDRDV